MKTEVKRTNHASAFFPVFRPKVDIDSQRMKVLEEIDEFLCEVQSGKSIKLMAEELNDAYQAFVTMVGMVLEDDDAVIEFIEEMNQNHRMKMERYKAERGWS